MSSKEDIKKYPIYLWRNKQLFKLNKIPEYWNMWQIQCHHYIEQQYIRNNPEEFKKIEHLQKLFFLPADMHADLHAGSRRFKEKWGVEREKLLYKLEERE